VVSVCLITYNHEDFIVEAIESVLDQQLDCTWEFIIADDCSTDKTGEIVEDYAKANPNLIRKLDNSTNLGAAKNFLRLLDAAKGKYIAYLEGDDYWIDSHKLQKQMNYMEEHDNHSMCYHPVKWIVDGELTEKMSNTEDGATLEIDDVLRNGWQIRSSSMFWRRFSLPQGFESLYVGDYPLHILLADRGTIGFIREAMSIYRINPEGWVEKNYKKEDFRSKLKLLNDELFSLRFIKTVVKPKNTSKVNRRISNVKTSFVLMNKKVLKSFRVRDIVGYLGVFNFEVILKVFRKGINKYDRR
jgi:glycosyltransferase involved in cell wall biosynthesis